MKKLIRIGIMGERDGTFPPGYCGLWARMLEIAAHLFYVATRFVSGNRQTPASTVTAATMTGYQSPE